MTNWFYLFVLTLGLFTQVRAWVYRYHYYSLDEAKDMVYGPDGNIYVCGMSDNTNGYRDIIVVSLTQAGAERWVYRYNGPANNHDVAWALVYGDDGNIYVAGHSFQSGSTPDFTIISLTLTGSERWVYTYNGAGNSYDFAFDIAYGNNQIYAVGRETDASGSAKGVIICLNTSGVFQWKYTFDGYLNATGYSIIYGGDGNVYATSYWNDMVVVSLTSGGVENWVYRYNYKTPAPGFYCADCPHFITYGSDGNIYVGGYTDITDYSVWDSIFTTVFSLTTAGSLRWQYNFYEGQATLGYDGAGDGIYQGGNFYFTTKSSDNGQLKIIAVNSTTGARVWTYSYPWLSGYDYLYSIFLAGGFLYATGNRGGGNYNDIVLFKVDPTNGAGNLVYTYDNGGSDVAYKGVCSATGNIYLAGGSDGTGEDFIVLGNVTTGIEESENTKSEPEFASRQNFKFSVLPNPFTSYTKVSGNSQNEILVYDIQGRLMGRYKGNYIGEDLKPGVYFLKLDGSKLNPLKVLKIK
uniref:T9SS type A sorting domain-containing protein n=1 Tax=candidate division WOR-3 bacterium TaxID=2052148 RepID=A0A7C4TDI3_UNCW3